MATPSPSATPGTPSESPASKISYYPYVIPLRSASDDFSSDASSDEDYEIMDPQSLFLSSEDLTTITSVIPTSKDAATPDDASEDSYETASTHSVGSSAEDVNAFPVSNNPRLDPYPFALLSSDEKDCMPVEEDPRKQSYPRSYNQWPYPSSSLKSYETKATQTSAYTQYQQETVLSSELPNAKVQDRRAAISCCIC
ncbi:hypothetical protein PLICRDRAFT_44787 [Plicaturopsis crispa FD-325 SS-3]|nr:hypothetical protein PLICRDRAFT_44787 [Plicaturopsis crispa FD-325 SS-3]